MNEQLEIKKEEFIEKYPVGTRILWLHPKHRPHTWFPGVVVEPECDYPAFAPCVWFILDIDIITEGGDGISRFVGYEYQSLLELEPD